MYEFKTHPYEHQTEALRRSWKAEYYALFMEMGTGKTKVILDNAAALHEFGYIDGLMIVAPKGAYLNWLNEIKVHLPDRIDACAVSWSTNLTKTKKAEIAKLWELDDKLHIFVMNVEGIHTAKAKAHAEKFLMTHKSMLVVDESTTIKNRKAKRTKALCKLGRLAEYRRILTGLPITQSPLDLWAQCEFLQEGVLGRYYSVFEAHYAVLRDMHVGHRVIKKPVAYRHLDELASSIAPFSYRVTKDECLDLPNKIYTTRTVPMSSEQRRHYDNIKLDAMTQFADGSDTTIEGVLTELMRLHQITCGFLPNDEGEVHELENERIGVMLDVLAEAPGQAVLWCHFRHSIRQVCEAIARVYGPDSVAAYFGDTPEQERPVLVQRFQDPSDPLKYLVANRAGAYGLTLHAADTVIYYTNDWNLDVRAQSEDRCHRIGQKNHVTYVDLVMPNTIDEAVVKALKAKRSLADEVLAAGSIERFV